MSYITTYDCHGRYLSIVNKPVIPEGKTAPQQTPLPGVYGAYEGFASLDGQYHDIANGRPVDIPARPSAHHIFDYTSKQWAQDLVSVRGEAESRRSRMLTESDWVMIRAAETGIAVPVEWLTYRQALRDLTLQPGFPLSIDWPAKP